MKRQKTYIYVIILFLVHLPFSLKAQTETDCSFKEIINSKQYKIEVNYAHPQSGRLIYLTSLYSLTIKNDSIDSYLPFFGRAYSIPYGGGDGLRFKSKIKTYEIEKEKKKELRIRVETVTPEDSYTFFIIVYKNKSADINVMMNKRSSIRFSGRLEEINNPTEE